MATAKKDFALLIGIDDYSGNDFSQLKGAKNDAEAFAEWLKSKANVKTYLLLSKPQLKSPRRSDVVDHVQQLIDLSKKGNRIGRRLYIFLAGHGVSPDVDEIGLVMADANDDRPSYYPGRMLMNLFRGRGLFEEVVLCMDCCRDYDLELEPPTLEFKRRFDSGLAGKVRAAILFAAEFGKKSREKKFNKKMHGIFSQAVLTGLQGAAADGAGRVTGAGLKRYVHRFIANHKPADSEQRADLDHCPDDFVFVSGLPPRSAVVTIQLPTPGLKVVVKSGKPLQSLKVNLQKQGPRTLTVELPLGKIYVFESIDAAGKVVNTEALSVDEAQLHVQL
jgi:hypothetical protein